MGKPLIAEFFGTFVLALTILMATQTGENLLNIPIIAALILGLSVYSIGPISGCHINPAVTIGLFSIGQIRLVDAFGYLAVQLSGGTCALLVATTLGGITANGFIEMESGTNFIGELFGTTVFTFGIASVVYSKTPDEASGLVIGGSLLLGISVAIMFGAGGILNPAVALATGTISLSNIAGMVLGAIAGMNLYHFLQASIEQTT